MHKLRVIVKEQKRVTFGLSVPDEIAEFYSGCSFIIQKVSGGFMCISGCVQQPTKEEINQYKFEDCRI
jgi:hypothetical protein